MPATAQPNRKKYPAFLRFHLPAATFLSSTDDAMNFAGRCVK
jgi:hypothetical protein